jgi:hypothetical protein
MVATKFYLYWSYGWLDMFMHIFGGFLAGNMVLVGRQTMLERRSEAPMSNSAVLSVALLGGLLVGILWEALEFSLGVSKLGPNFVPDTANDLLMDLIGILIAYMTWIKIPHKNITTQI